MAAVMTAGLLLVGTGLAGCVDTGSKTGGPASTVVLTLADGYSDAAFEPAVAYFIKRVGALSGGAVRVRDQQGWGKLAPDFERTIVSDVASGKADLGWVGTRVFDTLGVRSFQALTAPMLIDGYDLEDAVMTSSIPRQMLAGTRRLGVTGLAVLGGGLRKPVAAAKPLLTVADWKGVTVQALRSDSAAAALRAVGATPTDDLSGAVPFTAAERNLRIYRQNYVTDLPYVTADVNLWPETIALLANPTRLGRLTAEQRGWVQRAAKESAAASTALVDHDQDILTATCARGARYADAGAAGIAALRSALAGVTEDLEQDAGTRAFIERIAAMKAGMEAPSALEIPADCVAGSGTTSSDGVQGVWQTAQLTEGRIVQAFVAAGGDEAAGHEFFAQLGGGAERTAAFRLDFENGGLDQYESGDGGTFSHGDHRSYTVTGDAIALAAGGCTTTFALTLGSDRLQMRQTKGCEDEDAPYTRTIYGSFPFTRRS